jgi:hypothetical protein
MRSVSPFRFRNKTTYILEQDGAALDRYRCLTALTAVGFLRRDEGEPRVVVGS